MDLIIQIGEFWLSNCHPKQNVEHFHQPTEVLRESHSSLLCSLLGTTASFWVWVCPEPFLWDSLSHPSATSGNLASAWRHCPHSQKQLRIWEVSFDDNARNLFLPLAPYWNPLGVPPKDFFLHTQASDLRLTDTSFYEQFSQGRK